MDLGQGIRKALAKITGATLVDEVAIKELTKELQRVLITNDVNVKLVKEITARIEEKALKEKKAETLAVREHIAKIVYDELVAMLGEKFEPSTEKGQRILMLGLYGAGKCVAPSTRIPLADGTVKTIEELYQETNGPELVLEDGFVKEKPVKVFAFDPETLKVKETEAGKIWKLRKTDPLVKISLDNGSADAITVTPEHPFFVLKEGSLLQKRADEMKLGDCVALPRKLPFSEREDLLPILHNLPKATRVIDKEAAVRLGVFLREKYGTLEKACQLLTNRPYCGISAELKIGEIDAELLEKVVKLGFTFNYSDHINLIGGHRKTKFPTTVTPELAEFLGYFYGDGNIEEGVIHLTNADDEVIKRFCFLSEKLFEIKPTILNAKRSKVNLRKASVASKTIVTLLSNLLNMPYGAKSSTMKLPSFIMAAPAECSEKFLRAYFDCDGYVVDNRRSIEFVTASREFAYQLRVLLLKHNISSSYSIKKVNDKDYYRMMLRASDAEEFAAQIGAGAKHKQERLNKLFYIGREQTRGRLENLPVGNMLKEVREYYGATIGELQKHVNAYGVYESEGVISRSALKKFLIAVKKTSNRNNEILNNCPQATNYNILKEKMQTTVPWLNACLYRLREVGYLEENQGNFKTTESGRMLLKQHQTFDQSKITWLETLAYSDLAFCQVNKIEQDESTEYVYDLTVDNYHNFVAEGFIVHNTTTIGKLAKFYQKKGLHVGVIAGDVHRPTAFEQLQQLATQAKCDFYGNPGKSAWEIAITGLDNLKHCDVIIFDSAGRSAFDSALASELKKVAEVLKPTDSFLVVSADVGQVAGRQAEEFTHAVPITGVIVTKMDGSGKGGGALSSVHASKSKVAFIGVGEKLDNFEIFDAKKFVAGLVGFPDLETLLEKVKDASDEKALEKAMEKGSLDYETFMAQMRSMKKMGPLKQILQLLGMHDIPEELMQQSEEKMKKFECAVNSMTLKERRTPELMRNKARQERVAKGAGIKLEEVRDLVKNFENISKMLDGAKKNKGLLKRFAGKMPKGFDLSKLGGMGLK